MLPLALPLLLPPPWPAVRPCSLRLRERLSSRRSTRSRSRAAMVTARSLKIRSVRCARIGSLEINSMREIRTE